MPTPITNRFTQALHEAEAQHSPEPLMMFFTERSRLQNLSRAEPWKGRKGAREFWNDYFAFFRNIRTEFTNTIEAHNVVVLEWQSTGNLKEGEPFNYRGVCILGLELDGAQILFFRTYYDTAALLKPAAV